MDFSHRLNIVIIAVLFLVPRSGLGSDRELPAIPMSEPPSSSGATVATSGIVMIDSVAFDRDDSLIGNQHQTVGRAEISTPSDGLLVQSARQKLDYPPIAETDWKNLVEAVASGETTSIRVMGASVGPNQLSKLQAAENLSELWLDAGQVDDCGLVEIARNCPKLEILRLRFSPISDSGAACLAKLKELTVLNLPQSQLSSKGIKHLRDLPCLELLRLGGSKIDDLAVAEISLLPKLESLHLIGPRLTEKSLVALSAAPDLTSLYLDGCSIGEDGWLKLRQAKPQLHIHLDQPHKDQLQPFR